MWLKIAKIDLAGRTKKSIGGADSHYIYIYKLKKKVTYQWKIQNKKI